VRQRHGKCVGRRSGRPFSPQGDLSLVERHCELKFVKPIRAKARAAVGKQSTQALPSTQSPGGFSLNLFQDNFATRPQALPSAHQA
jgi:hypothetical protein